MLLVSTGLGVAQTTPRPQSPAEIEQRRAEQEARRRELLSIEERLYSNTAARSRLETEIGSLREDRARLNAALIEATRKAQTLEARISATESRLNVMTDSEGAIRRSLEARRDLIADVLGALQRMGRRPPPAVLVQPEDMLSAVRASILLGAVVPELRQEAETLALDLQEQVRLRERIAADRRALTSEFEGLALERQRLGGLVEARRERETAAGRDIAAEQKQGETLAEQARNLREFLARIETELATASRLAEEARKTLESQAREARERMAALAFRDPARLQPKIAFAEARGLLPMPVSGEILARFGAGEGANLSRGLTIATQPSAIVSAPADAWVAYAGPYRSFGQLLILNAGSGYYLVLSGLKRIDVTLGQFVLAGEPVGAMGEARDPAIPTAAEANGEQPARAGNTGAGNNGPSGANSASAGNGTATAGVARPDTDRTGVNKSRVDNPALYVEFRKDGVPIDPGPWWAKTDDRRVRG
ncbi:MAG: murein hydrolase activator EnvC family protein [Bosea sp. (in: a-proteobacteria)]